MQLALKWRLQDCILRFKVNWSLSQSCIVFVLVLILLFVLSVWVFSSWLCTALNGWSATEPRIDVLPGGLAVRMGPWAALPSPKKSPPEMHSRKHTCIKVGAVLLPISRSAIWTTLNQGKTDFQGRPSHFVNNNMNVWSQTKKKIYDFLIIEMTWFLARCEKFHSLSHHVFG